MPVVRYTERETIAASPEAAFDLRLDFERLPSYNPAVSNLRRADDGTAPGPGARYEFEVTIEGMGAVPTVLTVTEAFRPSRIVNESNAGLVATEVVTFEAGDDGTAVTFAVSIPVPDGAPDDALALIEKAGREQVRAELEHMKRILEEAG